MITIPHQTICFVLLFILLFQSIFAAESNDENALAMETWKYSDYEVSWESRSTTDVVGAFVEFLFRRVCCMSCHSATEMKWKMHTNTSHHALHYLYWKLLFAPRILRTWARSWWPGTFILMEGVVLVLKGRYHFFYNKWRGVTISLRTGKPHLHPNPINKHKEYLKYPFFHFSTRSLRIHG